MGRTDDRYVTWTCPRTGTERRSPRMSALGRAVLAGDFDAVAKMERDEDLMLVAFEARTRPRSAHHATLAAHAARMGRMWRAA